MKKISFIVENDEEEMALERVADIGDDVDSEDFEYE